MNTDRYRMIAFIGVLVSINILVIVGALLAAAGKGSEALGIAGAVTGLIGVIGTFKPGQLPPPDQTLTLRDRAP